MKYNTIKYNTIQYNTTQYNKIQNNTKVEKAAKCDLKFTILMCK